MKLRITISKYQTWYLRLMSLHKSCYYLYKLRKLTYLHFFEFFFSSTFKDFNTISRKNQYACLVRKSATAINWGFVGDSSPVLSIWIVTARSAIKKVFFLPYNKSSIVKACSVKMAGYRPGYFLRFYCSALSRSTNTRKRTWPLTSQLQLDLLLSQ